MKLLLTTMYPLFIVTALITHFWTVSIALQEAGSTAAMLTFLLPFVSEVYWIIKTTGQDNIYACIALVHLVLGSVLAFSYARSRFQHMVSKN